MRAGLLIPVAAALVLAASHLDRSSIGPFWSYTFVEADTVVHLVAYCWLGFLFARMLSSVLGLESFALVVLAGLLSGLFGVLHEAYQLYVCHKRAELHDVLVDILGGTTGGFIAWFGVFCNSLERYLVDPLHKHRARVVSMVFTACTLAVITGLPLLLSVASSSPGLMKIVRSYMLTGDRSKSIRFVPEMTLDSHSGPQQTPVTPEAVTTPQATGEATKSLAGADSAAVTGERGDAPFALTEDLNPFVEVVFKEVEKVANDVTARDAESERPTGVTSLRRAGAESSRKLTTHGPVAVIVHPENPLHEMTMDDLQKLVAGDYANWRKVGGSDLPVSVVAPVPPGRRTEELVRSFVGDRGVSDYLRLPFASLVFVSVAQSPGAVGFVPIRGILQRNWIEQSAAIRCVGIAVSTRHPDVYF